MIKIRAYFVLLSCFFLQLTWAQTTTLNGTVYGTDDVEGIHVINKTQRKATTTDAKGSFNILAKLNDTLVFSGIKYKLESFSVDNQMVETKIVKVFLTENINQLEEVVVGKVLTGDLLSDIQNSDAEPAINFYDVGIPGYKGKPKTKSERLLAEAGELTPSTILIGALTGSIPLNPIINAISGRTKMLKQRVKLEAQDALMFSVKAKFSEVLFAESTLEEELLYEFFYFCSEDPEFMTRCSGNDIETLEFLQQKLAEYKENLKN